MLQIRSLSKSFRTPGAREPFWALRDLSLAVSPGEWLIVVGSNGSGKSTLLNALAGEFQPDAGSIHLGSRDITRLSAHRRAAWIGRVFQDPFAGTAPSLTLAENLALALDRGVGHGPGWALTRRRREILRTALQRLGLGLEERLDVPIGQLSGGQRQAVTLLMATLVRPDLLLLDEHTAALDPKSADRIARLSQDLIRRQGLTAIMVTHSMSQACHYGDRLVLMHRGQVALDVRGVDKSRLRPEDILRRFEELRRRDQLGEDAARVLRERYA